VQPCWRFARARIQTAIRRWISQDERNARVLSWRRKLRRGRAHGGFPSELLLGALTKPQGAEIRLSLIELGLRRVQASLKFVSPQLGEDFDLL
jgi:hypothetical protein